MEEELAAGVELAGGVGQLDCELGSDGRQFRRACRRRVECGGQSDGDGEVIRRTVSVPTALRALVAVDMEMSDVGDQLDRLPGHRGYGLEIVIVAQQYESFAFCGRGNEQVDWTS